MSLFGRKKDPSQPCTCSCSSPVPPQGQKASAIQVLGSGCKSCRALLEAANQAVQALGLTTEVEYVTDPEQIMRSGVMRLPALVVHGQVVSMGRVLSAREAEAVIAKALETA